MRKIWLISIVAFVFLAMAACAHTPSGQRIYRVRGTVETYDPGKMIKLASRLEVEGYSDEGEVQIVTPSGPDEFTFAIAPDADVKGTIKPGERVLIRYTKAGEAKTAVSIEKVWGK